MNLKRFILMLCCAILPIFLVGCNSIKGGNSHDLIINFESDAKINVNDKKYECRILHTAEGVNNVSFVKPKNIKGLTFVWENDKHEVLMKDLSGEFNKELLPRDSFVVYIIDALNSLSVPENVKFLSKNDDENLYSGKSNSGNFEFTANSEGQITNLMIKDKSITVEFVQ